MTNDDAPPDGIRRDLPPVQHSIRCLCAACIADRQAEARRYREDARREEKRGRELAFLEALGGPVYARLGTPKRPMPGTVAAINARYGRRSA
jgi:hypothetical protein